MKRISVLFLILLLTPVMVFAAGKQEAEQASENGEESPELITMLIDKDSNLDGFNAVAEAAEEKLNIKVEIEIRPGGSEGDNVVKTRLATGDMTDILGYNSGSLLQALNPSEHFMDLSNEPLVDRLNESYVNTVNSGNAVYGVPFSSTQAGAWLYNKRVYEELGLDVPKTWEQLMHNCDVIKEAGKTPIIGSYKDSWTAQLIFLADHYNVLSEDPDFPEKYTAGEAKYASNTAGLRSWERLSETSGYMNRDYLATTYDGALEMLVYGDGVHYPMLTQALSYIYEIYPEFIDDIGVFGQPGDNADDHGLTIWMPLSMYVNKNSPKAETAVEFLDFYVSDEAVAIYTEHVKPDGPYAVKGIELPEDSYAGVLEMQSYFDKGRTAPALEFQSPVKGSSAPQICVECGAGIKTAEESAAAYDRDVRKQAIQLGLPGWE